MKIVIIIVLSTKKDLILYKNKNPYKKIYKRKKLTQSQRVNTILKIKILVLL